ncbi:GGDEF domain-containing protein [Acuticoccus mangrovi]|uniref:diguanylate cyclase n=1 Tax=Acuticoccus mangrovi TaxID=2796142 RepID=A0A934IKW3_9HYPH|nr:diguanylate cyclase [Acuticoccus mangrovi]MBJ3774188.1 diguanylate cyclase [Acuticoccus mangrovi]
MAFVALLYGLTVVRLSGSAAQVALGVLLGGAAVLAMLDPSEVAPGVLVDARTTPLLLSGLFGGPVAAVISCGISAAFRFHLGGIGATPGIAGMVMAAVVGSAVRFVYLRRGRPIGLGCLLLLAGLSPILSVTIFLLPMDMARDLFKEAFLPLGVVRAVSIVFLGWLMLNEQKRTAAETEVRRLAFVDELSGLANRRAFYRQLEAEWQRWCRYHHPFSIMMVDIDSFKSINDRFGHPAGDDVIRRLATLMRDVGRATDVPARIGGEEFAILVPNTDPRDAAVMAERLRRNVERERVVVDGTTIGFTISVGVSLSTAHRENVQELLSSADTALYDAKRGGRNRVIVAKEGGGEPVGRARGATSTSIGMGAAIAMAQPKS